MGMPALPSIANTFRCAFRWSDTSGQNAVNVIHITTSAAGRTPLQVFTALDANVDTNMWGFQSTNAAVDSIDITPLDGVSATNSFLTGRPGKWTGQSGGTDYTPAVSALIKLQTVHRGRSHRGRIFLPFVVEGMVTRGVLDAGVVASVGAAWSDYADDLVADATTPCSIVVASYKLASADVAHVVSCESVAGTQRRRQGRLR
jgi:hypothetical protein